MTIDERVRDALHAYADPIEPAPGSWDSIEARLDERLPRERRPRTPLLVAAVGILVIVALIAAAVVRDLDDGSNVTVDGGVGAPMPGRIAAVTTTGRVVELDAATGKVLDEKAPAGTSSGEQVAVAPDGRAVYFGPRGFDRSCADRSLSKLTLEGPVRSVDPIAARSLSPAPSPDGKYLAYLRCSTSSTRPDEIVLRDLATNAEQVTSAPSSMRLGGGLEFASDSRHVVLGIDGQLHRLDLVSGEALPGEAVGVAAGATPRGSRDDEYLVLKGSPGTVLVATGPQPFTASRLFELPETSKQLATDASGNHVLSATVNGSLYRWSVGDEAPTKIADGIETAAWISGPKPPDPEPEFKPSALPSQRVLVFGTTARGAGSMEILPSTSGGGVGDMGSADRIRAGTPVAVSDGFAYVVRKSVNSTCGDGDSIFRQPIGPGARSGDEISNATAPAVSPDGKYLAYLTCDSRSDGLSLEVRDRVTDQAVFRDSLGSYDPRRLQFSPDGKRLLVGYRSDSGSPFTPRVIGVDGVQALTSPPGLAVPVQPGVDATSWWDADSLTALGNGPEGQAAAVVSVASGAVERELFDASRFDGTVTNVIANVAGTAVLVVVDDARLFWWALGMAQPVRLDEKMLTAAWMPDLPASTAAADARVPDDFPRAVPRPKGLELRAVVTEKNPPVRRYTLTYAMDGVDANAVFYAYVRALPRAHFDVRASTSGIGAETKEGRIRAEGKRWDVRVSIGPNDRTQRLQWVLEVSTLGAGSDVLRFERAGSTTGG